MSGFSFGDLEILGTTANEIINSVTRPLWGYGDINQVDAGDALEESGSSHNEFLLGSGEHQGVVLEKPLGSLKGAPGAIITELAEFKASTKVDGLFFKQLKSSKNLKHLVVVHSPAKVVFTNCIFQRQAGAEASNAVATDLCFVLVNSGAKAVFTGCSFRSSADTGVMSNLPGLAIQDLNGGAGSVFVGLGSNYSGHTHAATVTNVGGEIT